MTNRKGNTELPEFLMRLLFYLLYIGLYVRDRRMLV